MSSPTTTLNWGIIATGLISSWFVQDLSLSRENPEVSHVIQAVGSSSPEKGRAFVEKHLPGKSITVYGSYEEVYADPRVEVVYIGTPHAFHKQNCLDAIRHGKHILCEKAFALNAAEARDVFDAARKKGVFVMEAMWTRFFPLVRSLQTLIHSEKVIGDIHRVFCDFAMNMNLSSLGPESRLKNPALGAGSLLDIGVYSLTWGLLALDPRLGAQAERPTVVAAQSLAHDIDVASSIILLYPNGRQGILTTHTAVKTSPGFCRIEGSEGFIVVEGLGASVPASFTVHSLNGHVVKHEFERPGKGFYWEADAVALDIAAGKTEDTVMPWAETIRVLELLDAVRTQGGAKFPQDEPGRQG